MQKFIITVQESVITVQKSAITFRKNGNGNLLDDTNIAGEIWEQLRSNLPVFLTTWNQWIIMKISQDWEALPTIRIFIKKLWALI